MTKLLIVMSALLALVAVEAGAASKIKRTDESPATTAADTNQREQMRQALDESVMESISKRASRSQIERMMSLYPVLGPLRDPMLRKEHWLETMSEDLNYDTNHTEIVIRSGEAAAAAWQRFNFKGTLSEKQRFATVYIVVGGLKPDDSDLVEMLSFEAFKGQKGFSAAQMLQLYQFATDEYEKRGIQRKGPLEFEWKPLEVRMPPNAK